MMSAKKCGFVVSLYRIRHRIRLMLVCAMQPVAQVRRRFVRRFAIEGHHRGGHARNPDDVGAPAFFGDPCHFNDERSARYDSFETVPHDGV